MKPKPTQIHPIKGPIITTSCVPLTKHNQKQISAHLTTENFCVKQMKQAKDSKVQIESSMTSMTHATRVVTLEINSISC